MIRDRSEELHAFHARYFAEQVGKGLASTNGEYRRWSWEILEGPYAGRKVYANTSTNFGPQAKARQWVENILGRELEAGEQVGVEDLVGGKHHLMIENVKRDGRTFDNVSSVHKYRE